MVMYQVERILPNGDVIDTDERDIDASYLTKSNLSNEKVDWSEDGIPYQVRSWDCLNKWTSVYTRIVEDPAPTPTETDVLNSLEFSAYLVAYRNCRNAQTIPELSTTTDALVIAYEQLADRCQRYVHLTDTCTQRAKQALSAEVIA